MKNQDTYGAAHASEYVDGSHMTSPWKQTGVKYCETHQSGGTMFKACPCLLKSALSAAFKLSPHVDDRMQSDNQPLLQNIACASTMRMSCAKGLQGVAELTATCSVKHSLMMLLHCGHACGVTMSVRLQKGYTNLSSASWLQDNLLSAVGADDLCKAVV